MKSKQPQGETRRNRTIRGVTALLALGLLATGCSRGSDADIGTRQGGDTSGSVRWIELPDGVPAVFDASVVHSIQITFDQDAYDEMIATYRENGTKDWIEGTVTIDGQTFEKVGLKLKGNSSLRGLGTGRGARPRPDGGNAATDGTTADRSTTDGSTTESTTTSTAGNDVPLTSSSTSDVDPVTLPWRIRFDKFVTGQTYQGHSDVVVRANNSRTSLNEAVALALLSEAGLASEASASTSFSVNGSDPMLRLIVELPDDDAWQDSNFTESGALYKAKSTGDWSYRGEDQADYAEAFEQKGGKKTTDLTPLIEFLDFINNADDETFESELSDRLDVDSFATYLAMMDLLDNFDDISGPGNNSYLWWDATTERFTVVPWDMNLAFAGGGFGGGTNDGAPSEGFRAPDGRQPPEGFQRTDGATRTNRRTADTTNGQRAGRVGNMRGRSNPLVDRFHDTKSFEELYQSKLTELRKSLFTSGKAAEILDARAATLTRNATDLVDADMITNDVESIRAKFSE